ncbi:hypothetical protein R1flu_002013 [Riccia fluitans]|uniref:Uncharacterized protein n=1 Tax=Riccia fluitans TaxID=41844 RepID=A0ABD1Y4W9_9MARC
MTRTEFGRERQGTGGIGYHCDARLWAGTHKEAVFRGDEATFEGASVHMPKLLGDVGSSMSCHFSTKSQHQHQYESSMTRHFFKGPAKLRPNPTRDPQNCKGVVRSVGAEYLAGDSFILWVSMKECSSQKLLPRMWS